MLILSFISLKCIGLERWSRKRKVGCSNPSRNRPKSLTQAVTGPLLKAWQLVRVSRNLGDDHYKESSLLNVHEWRA